MNETKQNKKYKCRGCHFLWHSLNSVVSKSSGVFSTGAIGALAPIIVKNRLLAPAISGHFSTVGKIVVSK